MIEDGDTMFLGISKLSEKKQITLSKEIIEKLDLKIDGYVIFLEKETNLGNDIVIKKVSGEEVADLIMKKQGRV